MSEFRWAIMGAGDISRKFCDAARRVENCTVAAVSSKSAERAEAFAKRENIPSHYSSYEEMLVKERPDCVYIGADTGSHFALTMLCLEHKIPVLCEKAMFCTAAEAEKAMKFAKEQNTFMMEAMWSYYLPAIKKAKEWVDGGKIGRIYFSDALIGFKAPTHPGNRYFNRELGGGTAYDLTVYTYDLTVLMLGRDYIESSETALWDKSGVDAVDHVVLKYNDAVSSMTTSIIGPLEERLILYGEEGKIVVPSSHFASQAFLYDKSGNLLEHFKDDVTENGFYYEVKDATECVIAGKLESDTVPHSVTLDSAKLYDRINSSRPERKNG